MEGTDVHRMLPKFSQEAAQSTQSLRTNDLHMRDTELVKMQCHPKLAGGNLPQTVPLVENQAIERIRKIRVTTRTVLLMSMTPVRSRMTTTTLTTMKTVTPMMTPRAITIITMGL